MALPVALYSADQVRAFDARAIAGGIPGHTLMKLAGEGALRLLRSRWPTALRIAIACGPGNNGGDGYVLARFAQAAGLSVCVLAATDPLRLRGDAKRAYDDVVASGIPVEAFDAAALVAAEVVVDALVGIGARLPLSDELAAVVAAINGCGRPVFALDLPSGLDADTGAAPDAVRADATVSFVALKTGLFVGDRTGEGREPVFRRPRAAAAGSGRGSPAAVAGSPMPTSRRRCRHGRATRTSRRLGACC